MIGNTDTNYSLNINQGRYDDILLPCKVVDDKIVDDYLDPINDDKQSIQQLVIQEHGLVEHLLHLTPGAAQRYSGHLSELIHIQ